jgi:hypothetical protein
MAESNQWTVTIKNIGRGGKIFYQEGAALLTLDWDFGGNEVIVMIWGAHREDWNQALPWASGRKEEILNRIATEVLSGPGKGCKAEFDLEDTTIYLKKIIP